MNNDPSSSVEVEDSEEIPWETEFEERMCNPEDSEYDESFVRFKRNPISSNLNNEIFLLDAPNFEISDNNEKWLKYAKNQLDVYEIPSQNARLVGHHHVNLAQTVRMWLLQVDLIVLYKEKEKVVPVVLTDCRQGAWFYRVVGEKSTKAFIEKNMITKLEEAKEAMKEVMPKYNITKEDTFYAIKDFEEAQPYLGLSVYQCVKGGQFVEYQLSERPEVVCFGRVTRNYRGLLLIWFGPNIGERWIHMCDPYLHAVGWSRDQTTKYEEFAQNIRIVNLFGRKIKEKLKTEAVPSFVFRYNCIPPHRLSEGDILVVADHFSNAFHYSHVVNTNPPSETFFHLAFGDQLMKNPNNRPCYYHIHHPRIFSVKKIHASGIHIRLPSIIYLNTNEPDLVGYKRVFSPDGKIVNDNCGVHYLFLTTAISKWDQGEKIDEQLKESEDTLRFVEVLRPVGYDPDKWQLTGAVVTGQKQNLLRLATTTDKNPVYMHMHDWRIFHLGTCKDMNLAVVFDEGLLDLRNKVKKLGTALTKFASF